MRNEQVQRIASFVDKLVAVGRELVERGDRARDYRPRFLELKAHCRTLVRVLGKEADPWQDMLEPAEDDWDRGDDPDQMLAALRAIQHAMKAGFLMRIEDLVRADLFADFLEMAEYLLQEGYKDPAAVIVGGVLEEHLRKLCDKNGIAAVDANGKPKKASLLNDDLAKAKAYDKLEQKNVTAWLDLRNKAAHGKYAEYESSHVEELLRGVRNFLTRCPA